MQGPAGMCGASSADEVGLARLPPSPQPLMTAVCPPPCFPQTNLSPQRTPGTESPGLCLPPPAWNQIPTVTNPLVPAPQSFVVCLVGVFSRLVRVLLLTFSAPPLLAIFVSQLPDYLTHFSNQCFCCFRSLTIGRGPSAEVSNQPAGVPGFSSAPLMMASIVELWL